MKYPRRFIILVVVLIAFLAGCAKKGTYEPVMAPSKVPPPKAPPATVPTKPSPPDGLHAAGKAPGLNFDDDLDVASLKLAIDRSLNYYENAGRNRIFQVADRQISAKEMKETLTAFRGIISSDLGREEKQKQIAENFLAVRASGEEGNGALLFTGYYEPLLEGSLVRTKKYRYPLYKPPTDLVMERDSANKTTIGRKKNGRLVPYYSRREIDIDGVLRGKGLELIWVSDPVELHSLHIQGSGKIMLEDGTLLTVSYARNNGRPFRSVTQYMLDHDKITPRDSSYRNFQTWLKGKSDQEILEILSHNERYIFFRFVDREPVGALGEPVTPERTLATDPDYFPQGALAFIRLSKPLLDAAGNAAGRVPFSRFVLVQDKGGDIKGPGRVDLFCGFGQKARITAVSLKEKGELYFLIRR